MLHKKTEQILDDNSVDGLLVRQMFDNPRSFNFTDEEINHIEASKRNLRKHIAFDNLVRLIIKKGWLK